MNSQKAAEVVSLLQHMSLRKGMYVGEVKLPAVSAFFSGFEIASQLFGYEVPLEIRQRAKEQRGWQHTNEVWPMEQMEAQNYTEEQIIDELWSLEIEAWKLAADARG